MRLALWRTTGDENFVQLAVTEAVQDRRSGAALGNATAWFASIGAPAVPVLLKNLKHPHPLVRRDAAFALQLMQPYPKQAVPALIDALKDTDPQVRKDVAQALIAIDAEAARKAGVKSPD